MSVGNSEDMPGAERCPVLYLRRKEVSSMEERHHHLMERLEDLELAELVRARRSERRVKVKLDDL